MSSSKLCISASAHQLVVHIVSFNVSNRTLDSLFFDKFSQDASGCSATDSVVSRFGF